jgi:hypothetical protein
MIKLGQLGQGMNAFNLADYPLVECDFDMTLWKNIDEKMSFKEK